MAKKINISINEDMLNKVDAFCEKNYMSRSGFFSLASNQYLLQVESLELVKGMAASMRKIADNGFVDEDTRKELEQFEKVAQYIGFDLKK